MKLKWGTVISVFNCMLKCSQFETLRLQLSRQTEEKLKVMKSLTSCQEELAKAVSNLFTRMRIKDAHAHKSRMERVTRSGA